jgi:hypothetical protein
MSRLEIRTTEDGDPAIAPKGVTLEGDGVWDIMTSEIICRLPRDGQRVYIQGEADPLDDSARMLICRALGYFSEWACNRWENAIEFRRWEDAREARSEAENLKRICEVLGHPLAAGRIPRLQEAHDLELARRKPE